ncbi:urotensin-2 [Erythrolamprus reginae]|uniref:urotensin-2 n=1 Tax=Erythrolamprus reginae TaxID=121349 RepID=UPI00396D0156
MGNLGWFCLFLLTFLGRVRSFPRTSEELSAWSPVNNEDAKFNLEPLTIRRSFQQALTRRLGAPIEDNPSNAGLGLPSFSAREYVKEAPIGSISQNMLLRRLWESAQKQYKRRRNLPECFWKYCV